MTGDKTNSSIAIYFIPEKSNALMTKKEQTPPPPQTNKPTTPPTKTHLIDTGHGVWEKAFSWSDTPPEAAQSSRLKCDLLAIFGVT